MNKITTQAQPSFSGHFQGIIYKAATQQAKFIPSKPALSCEFGDKLFLSMISKIKSSKKLEASISGSGKKTKITFIIPRSAYKRAFGFLKQAKRLLIENNLYGDFSNKAFSKVIQNPNVDSIRYSLTKQEFDTIDLIKSKSELNDILWNANDGLRYADTIGNLSMPKLLHRILEPIINSGLGLSNKIQNSQLNRQFRSDSKLLEGIEKHLKKLIPNEHAKINDFLQKN